MRARRQRSTRRAIAIVGLTALIAATLQVMVAPVASAAPPIFSDEFASLTNWTATRITLDNTIGSPTAPSARAAVTSQSASAFLVLGTTTMTPCMSANVNLSAGAPVDLFRLRTATNGAIIKAYVAANGTLALRSDFGSTTRTTTVALGTGWHNIELCGTVGGATTWNLYRDGTQIVTNWAANTGTTPVGRIQIGDSAAKTFTINFDHVVLDTAVGDDVPSDTTAPSVPGRPAGSSPSAGSIQISWAASTDPAPASLPITYRIYRDGGATSIGSSTTTSFSDTGLVAGSSHTYTVDAVDAANNASAKSQASLSITVTTVTDTTAPSVPGRPAGSSPSAGSIQISWAASTDPAPASLPITYRIYRDGGATSVGSTTTTSFTDTGLAPGSSHTYTVDARDASNNTSAKSQASLSITVTTVTAGGQPVPGHTRLVSDTTLRTDEPRITTGEITDLEYIGNRVFVAGSFTSIRNNTATNTTSYAQPYLASFNIDTGLVDANFRPTFGGGGVTEIAASPDGTKLFVVGRFNTVNGVTKRKIASINPVTGATITGFTANANSAATAVAASNTTVYVGGQFTAVNGTARVSLAAVNANTGAVVTGFVNNLSGGIGVNGELTVQALVLTHDNSKLLVVHTGRQIAGQDRYGMGLIDTQTNQLLPWRSRLWDDNLQFVGGVTRIYAGAIAPNDQYFVVSSGSGGDRPPISDTAVAYPMSGGDNVEPLWIARNFDSVYSIAISEVAVYIGGHFQWNESPTADDPWPGLTDAGYGTGQGLSAYGLGDQVVRRDHIGALDPATGKALEFDPGSNSFEGNKAMLVTPRGLVAGGDATTQGGANVGRVAFYDFNSIPAVGQDETTITDPIEGRVEPADQEWVIDGTATATSGVNRVQLQVQDRDRNQYLQDNLTSWGGFNTINVNLASPNATSTTWSLPLTLSGNRRIMLRAQTFGTNGSSDSSMAIKRIETFGLADATPTTNVTGPNGSVIPTTTFTVTGTAQDDVGVNSISYSIRDAQFRYLQDDGSTSTTFNTFRVLPDVIGATSATWSAEITVPYEASWTFQATAVDTAGQSDLRSAAVTWIVSATAIPPTVTIATPAVMTPPTAIAPLTMAPGSPVTFSGTAADDEGLADVTITLRNSVTRENLASDGTWGVGLVAGSYRISPVNIGGLSYNWSYTTPFNLRPGTYSFTVSASDDLGLNTSSANRGSLTINVQVPGDAFPDGTISPTGTQPNLQVLHLDLAGNATDDIGVSAVRLTIQDNDTSRYLQSNGTLAAGYALLDATLANPNGTSTGWTLSVNLPSQGDYSVTAFAYDTSGQQDPSTSGATSRYPAYPGDLPPAFVAGLFSPADGTAFTDGRIVVSGRVEDDQQIAQAQVAVRNGLGQYMSSSGGFTSTNVSYRTAFLNSPGSLGSNFSFTTPVIPPGAYTVLARGVDQHGFTTNPPMQVNVTVSGSATSLPPVANFTYSCVQNVCSFDGRTSTDENPPTLTYSWNFGQGSGSGPVPTRTYTAPNTYTVTLTVRDENGLSGVASQTVTIVEPAGNLPPVPVINPPSCAARVCNISGVGSADPNIGDAPPTYLWNFGDGTATSTSSSSSHTFPADGTYTVTLTTTDGWGKAASTTRTITIAEPPTNVAPNPVINPVTCAARACTIFGVSSSDPNGDAFTYLWNFGDGTATSTAVSPVHTFAADGNYTVSLTVTDAWGKAASTTRVITIAKPGTNAPPAPVIGAPSCIARVCSMSSAGSSDPNGDAFTYLWNFGDGTPTSTASAPSHTFPANSSYTVTLTLTDAWGDAANTTRVVAFTEPPTNGAPVPVIDTPACTARACVFSGVTSSDPDGDTFTYLWNFGDGTPTSTVASPSHTYAVDNTYTVTLTLTDAWGKAASTTRVVTIAKPPTNLAPIPVINPVVCAARVCTIYGVSSSDPNSDTFTYLWNFGDGTATATAATNTHTFAADGTYTVTLTVTDAWGDAASTTRAVTIAKPGTNVAPVPVINTASCLGLACSFSGVGSADPNGDPFTYSWNWGDLTAVATTQNATHTYLLAGTYTVTLTVTDGWGDANSTTRVVTIIKPPTNAAPVPVINAPTCVALVCTFSGVGSADPNGDPFTYSWNWGDLSATATGVNPPAHTFLAGTYTVTLTVTDWWGDARSTTRVVTVP